MTKSSDPIVLSLKNATDDRDFELLCSDILAGTVCPGLEPIGGTSDGGRDALYRDELEESVTICAFSLRQDWKTKLKQDCERVKALNHVCDRMLFATSMQPTPTERDEAVTNVREQFGWMLELYGRERLATAIRGKLEHLLERHPGIFRKEQFRLAGGRLLESSRRDLLLIDHVDRDQGFAMWIARCLRLVGYDVWCRGINSTSGEIADTAIRELLERRARHHLPVLSKVSVSSPEFRGRMEQSAGGDRRLLPLRFELVECSPLSPHVRAIDPIAFENHRASGMRNLISKLDEWGVPKDHEVARGRRTSLRLPTPNDFLRQETEVLVSNIFPVTKVPNLIYEWRLNGRLNYAEIQIARQSWAFVNSGEHVYSFVNPPNEISNMVVTRNWKGADWRDVKAGYFDGKSSRDIVSELLRRTLEVAFYSAGLVWCPDSEMIYFPPERFLKRKLPVMQLNGIATNRAVCGKKHRWQPNEKGEDYDWQLSPDCRCFGGIKDPWEIRSRVRIRVTYPDGRPIESKRVITFRRHAANGWYQDRFRDLNLLFMVFAASGESEIVVGSGSERVAISTTPITFTSPVSIHETLLPKGSSKFTKREETADTTEMDSEP